MAAPLPRTTRQSDGLLDRLIFASRLTMDQLMEHLQKHEMVPLEAVVIGPRFTSRLLSRLTVMLMEHLEKGSPQYWSFMRITMAALLPTYGL
jgi:hypothetical protein